MTVTSRNDDIDGIKRTQAGQSGQWPVKYEWTKDKNNKLHLHTNVCPQKSSN